MESVYTVSQINQYIKRIFEQDYELNRIYVKGEVSNCKYHSSGHIYFTIKDSGAQIACVMFAGQRNGLNFQMKEGQSVIVFGTIGVYERDGKYQLYAREIRQDGIGILYEQYEQLKRKLEAEGLFRPDQKKKIKEYPTKVGIVTAKTGAAIQDMIHITERRNPYVQLILYPAKVQGQGAAETIVKGIQCLDAMKLDTIIIGRGGGSIEDLWAFNEESVARAIYACNTPVISAVGHETDVTIADFVADLRAPTPSAAAELAVGTYESIQNRFLTYMNRMELLLQAQLKRDKQKLEQLSLKLNHQNPVYQLTQKKQHLEELKKKMENRINRILEKQQYRLMIDAQKLEGNSPLNKLKSGYAFVTDENKKPIQQIEQTAEGKPLWIAVSNGDILAYVERTEKRERFMEEK